MRNFLLNDTCYERLIYATSGLILALFCLADPLCRNPPLKWPDNSPLFEGIFNSIARATHAQTINYVQRFHFHMCSPNGIMISSAEIVHFPRAAEKLWHNFHIISPFADH